METEITPAPETETTEANAPEPEVFVCPACETERDNEEEVCPNGCYHCGACDRLHDPDYTTECDACSQANRRNPHRYARCCDERCESHWYCSGCDTRHDFNNFTQCSNCDDCTEYHDCSYCEGCDEYTSDSVCGDCDRCDSCECECTNHNVRFVQNPLVFHAGAKCPVNPSTRFIALEIEVSEASAACAKLDEVVEDWSASVVTDGSIPEGFEINTAPASGSKLVEQLAALGVGFDKAQADANSKCGVHVHVDVRDFNFAERAKLCWLWAATEHVWFSLVPKSRRQSKWCLKRAEQVWQSFGAPRAISPAEAKASLLFLAADDASRPSQWDSAYEGKPELFKRDLARWERMTAGGRKQMLAKYEKSKPTTLKGKGENRHGGRRYFAFNVQSMFDHGTVEIRLHENCVNTEHLTQWGALLAAFVDAAKKAKIEEIAELANGMRSPWEWLMSIAPEGARAKWENHREDMADRW